MPARVIPLVATLIVGPWLPMANSGAPLANWWRTQQASHTDALQASVLAANERFWQAASDHDLSTLGELIAGNYVGKTPDGTRWDKASILAQHDRVRTGDLVRVTKPEVVPVSDDAVILSYEASFKIYARDGALVDQAQQKMISCWVRQNGHWRVAFADVSNAAPSPILPSLVPGVVAPEIPTAPIQKGLERPDDIYIFPGLLYDAPRVDP